MGSQKCMTVLKTPVTARFDIVLSPGTVVDDVEIIAEQDQNQVNSTKQPTILRRFEK
jgi:hypothetical protein